MWALLAVLAVAAGLAACATPALVLGAASGPVLFWTALLLAAGRRVRPPLDVVAAALLGGAVVAATLAEAANTLAVGWSVRRFGATPASSIVPTIVGPLVEELAKGLVLLLVVLLRRDAFAGPRDGLVWGALVGLGFTMHENLRYLTLAAVQGGPAGLAQGVVVRGLLAGPTHAVFAAATGVGLGWALRTPPALHRGAVVALAFAVAVGQHALWNGVGSLLVMRGLCGPEFPAVGCMFPPSPVPPPAVVLATAGFLVPGAIVAWLAARRLDPARRPPGSQPQRLVHKVG